LAKSIIKKYRSTDLYLLQDRKTNTNLKKGQLVTGLRLQPDIYIVLPPGDNPIAVNKYIIILLLLYRNKNGIVNPM
jgi:hypothetical protein